MKKLVQSTQYKRDLKRIRNDAKKAEALLGILTKLENEIPIPPENRPHLLDPIPSCTVKVRKDNS